MSERQTCGPMYQQQLKHYAGDDPLKIRLFAAGFISGEAEKIYLGSCLAAMFRPSKENFSMVLEVARQVAQTYGLYVDMVGEDEIWIFNCDAIPIVTLLKSTLENSRAWHLLRGVLTGVALRDIDYEFHKRKGYRERCD